MSSRLRNDDKEGNTGAYGKTAWSGADQNQRSKEAAVGEVRPMHSKWIKCLSLQCLSYKYEYFALSMTPYVAVFLRHYCSIHV